METLMRNATLRFSRRVEKGSSYEPLNPTDNHGHVSSSHQLQVSFSRIKSYREDKLHGIKKSMFSRPKSYRKNIQDNNMKNSLSTYKRDRARKRHIFLQSYKLSSMETSNNRKKLKRAVVKVKSLVVSVLSFIRGGNSFRSCNSRSAISVSLPVPIQTRVLSCC